MLRTKFCGVWAELKECQNNRAFIEVLGRYLGKNNEQRTLGKRKGRENMMSRDEEVKRKKTAEGQDVFDKYRGENRLELKQLSRLVGKPTN